MGHSDQVERAFSSVGALVYSSGFTCAHPLNTCCATAGGVPVGRRTACGASVHLCTFTH